MGICNGFQILCEAGLLPGVLIRNQDLQFHCEWVHLRVERTDTAFTNAAQVGQVLRVPISHGEGNYFADPETLARIEANDGRASALIAGIVESVPFQKRRRTAADGDSPSRIAETSSESRR